MMMDNERFHRVKTGLSFTNSCSICLKGSFGALKTDRPAWMDGCMDGWLHKRHACETVVLFGDLICTF